MKICIVDDDQLVSLSLKTILETDEQITIAGIGNSGEEAIRLYDEQGPDILLMDIRMGGMNGLEAAATILRRHPDAKILLLTTFSDDEYIIEALQTGVKGYVLKQNFDGILPALTAVLRGQTVLGNEIMTRLPELMKAGRPANKTQQDFTPRELELIRQVAGGKNNREIAQELFLSEGTVRNYLSQILEKLELRDRTQLAVYYYKFLQDGS